jgi:putative transposase
VSVAEWVRHVKGYTTHEVNVNFPDLPTAFAWQGSYGILTFGARQSQFVIDYIVQQKTRHANHQIEPYLERIDEE